MVVSPLETVATDPIKQSYRYSFETNSDYDTHDSSQAVINELNMINLETMNRIQAGSVCSTTVSPYHLGLHSVPLL